jgi:Prolyl oligopeptidase, N-terminal beta-propeller domain
MRHVGLFVGLAALLSSSALAGKPSHGGSPPPNPQIAYESLSGSSYKLIVSDENGTNASTLYSSASPIRFDLAPRSQHQIAIVDSSTSAALRLLTYGQTGSGSFAATSTVVLDTGAYAPRRGSSLDFSPDGTKLAYACNSNGIDTEHLCVYDLSTQSASEWGSDSFYWDLVWFRGGAAIAYSTEDPDGNSRLHEIDGAGSNPQVIFTTKGDLDLDSARTDPDALVLDYHDVAGNALVGLWRDGNFIDPNLAHGTIGFFGETNCTDTKLVYLGPPNNSPDWYIRDLNTGLSTTFSRSYLHWVQFWPTCS